jgi:uncharacterized coiled-coil protein SlyX
VTQDAPAGGGSIAPTTMLAIGIPALLGLVAGGFLLHSRFDRLETELAFAKRDVESTNERLMNLQSKVSQIRQYQSSAAAMIARLDNRLPATAQPTSPQNNVLQITAVEPTTAQPTSPQNNVLQITAVEAKLIREFLMKIDSIQAEG